MFKHILRTNALIFHASKVMLKILQARLQQYVNCELPDVQAGFRKARRIRDEIANIHWIIEKARVPRKHLLLLYWPNQSLWLYGSQQTVENSSRDGTTRVPYLLRNLYASLESTIRTGHERTDWFQIPWETIFFFFFFKPQGCMLSACLFNFYAEFIIWNARLDEAQTGSRLLGEISITSDMQMTLPLWQKVKRN